MGGVHLNGIQPRRAARVAAATKASRTRFRPAASRAIGGVSGLCKALPMARAAPIRLVKSAAAGLLSKAITGRLAPRVRELHANRHIRMLADRRQHRHQRCLGGVVIEPQIARRDPAFRFHGRGLDEQQARTRQRKMAEVNQCATGWPRRSRRSTGTWETRRSGWEA